MQEPYSVFSVFIHQSMRLPGFVKRQQATLICQSAGCGRIRSGYHIIYMLQTRFLIQEVFERLSPAQPQFAPALVSSTALGAWLVLAHPLQQMVPGPDESAPPAIICLTAQTISTHLDEVVQPLLHPDIGAGSKLLFKSNRSHSCLGEQLQQNISVQEILLELLQPRADQARSSPVLQWT